MEEEFKVAKRRAHELLSAAQAAGEPDEELKAQFENIPDSLEEIEELLAQEKAQADLAQDFDPAVVSAYERRKREVFIDLYLISFANLKFLLLILLIDG